MLKRDLKLLTFTIMGTAILQYTYLGLALAEVLDDFSNVFECAIIR